MPFLGGPQEGATKGRAVQVAQKGLYASRHLYGQLWTAYQHYGDPNSPLRLPELEQAA